MTPAPGRPSKVLFVIDGLWVGGTERSLAEMLPGLRRAGIHGSVAVLRRCAEGVEDEVRAGGTDVRLLPGPGVAAQALGLRRLVQEQGPEIVHSSLYRSSLVSRLALPGTGARLVTSLVNAPYSPERVAGDGVRRSRLRAVQVVDAVSGRFLTDHFHAVSEHARTAAIHDLRIPADRVTVVRRGRDPQRMGQPGAERRAASRTRLGIDPAAVVLANVGRQDPQKGQLGLVDAFARLAASDPRLLLVVVGRQGALTAEIERRIASAGLQSRVKLLGHRDDVPDILAAADVFVFPSLWEGLPGAIIEAMALGLPIVASRIPPHVEIIEEGGAGLLVQPADADGLAGALEAVIRDPARRMAMGERSRALFLERHTLARSLDDMMALYAHVLRPRRGGHA